MSAMIQRLSLVALCTLGTIMACSLIVARWPAVHIVPVVRAQEQNVSQPRWVYISFPRYLDAIYIVNISGGGQKVRPVLLGSRYPAASFQADDNWLKNLSFVVKNRTDKTITHLEIALAFPETAPDDGRPAPGYSIRVGRMWDYLDRSGNGAQLRQIGDEKAIEWAPGQEVTVSLADYLDRIREQVEENQPFPFSFSGLTKCEIRLARCEFDDGMTWDAGGYSVQDQSDPHRFRRLDPEYFPGYLKHLSTYAH